MMRKNYRTIPAALLIAALMTAGCAASAPAAPPAAGTESEAQAPAGEAAEDNKAEEESAGEAEAGGQTEEAGQEEVSGETAGEASGETAEEAAASEESAQESQVKVLPEGLTRDTLVIEGDEILFPTLLEEEEISDPDNLEDPEIVSRLNELPADVLENAQPYDFFTDNYSEEEHISLFADYPDIDTKLYLYHDGVDGSQGVIFDVDGTRTCFSQGYNLLREPSAGKGDYDGDGRDEIALIMPWVSGTEVSAQKLFIYEIGEDGKVSCTPLDIQYMTDRIRGWLEADYDRQSVVLRDENGIRGEITFADSLEYYEDIPEDLSTWEPLTLDAILFTHIYDFTFEGDDKIRLADTVGLHYEEYPGNCFAQECEFFLDVVYDGSKITLEIADADQPGTKKEIVFSAVSHPVSFSKDDTVLMTANYLEIQLDDETKEAYPALVDAVDRFNIDEETMTIDTVSRWSEDDLEYFPYDWGISYQSERSFYPSRQKDVLSFGTGIYTFLGGAHGFQSYSGINIDPKTGDEVALSEVISDPAALKDVIFEELLAQNDDLADVYTTNEGETSDKDILFENLDKALADDGWALSWTVTDEGIAVYFPDYFLGYYALGSRLVAVRYVDHPALFTDKYSYNVYPESEIAETPKILELAETEPEELTYNPDYGKLPAAVTAEFADDSEKQPENSSLYVLSDSPDAVTVVFNAEKPVRNFKILELECTFVTEDGKPVFNTNSVKSWKELVPGQPLEVTMEFAGDIPNNGFFYIDEDGAVRRFSLELSGEDGSLIATEIEY